MRSDWLLGKLFVTSFDGDSDAVAAAAAAATAATDDGGDADDAAAAAAAAAGAAGKTFTQDELNAILSREKKRQDDKTKKTITELEELKKSKSMTEQDRAKLAARIESLQDELLTKAQLASKERDKLNKTHAEERDKLANERETWRQRFTVSEITRSIYDASAEAGAFNGEDIGALLRPNTQLVEELDDQGNPLGSFTPKVKFKDTDKDGKPVTLDLTIKEAVKRMKDTPDRYGYLFKSTANSGLGMDGGAGRQAQVDISKMSPEQYREYRKKSKGGSVTSQK